MFYYIHRDNDGEPTRLEAIDEANMVELIDAHGEQVGWLERLEGQVHAHYNLEDIVKSPVPVVLGPKETA